MGRTAGGGAGEAGGGGKGGKKKRYCSQKKKMSETTQRLCMLSGDILKHLFYFLALDGLLGFSCTSKYCAKLVKKRLNILNQKIRYIALWGISSKNQLSRPTVACKVICDLVGGPDPSVRYARSLVTDDPLASRILKGPVPDGQDAWLHCFALIFLLCPAIKSSLTLSQTLAVWLLTVESRTLRPSYAEVMSSILYAASSFPESFPQEPVSVSFVAGLLGCGNNNSSSSITAAPPVGRLDTGEPRISAARIQYLNLIIQIVLGCVLPQEQRASRMCVLSRKMSPADRRRAVTTVMVWTHIWIGRH